MSSPRLRKALAAACLAACVGVLVPLRTRQAGRYRRYDWDTDRLEEWHEVPADAVLAFLSSMPWRGATAIFSLRDRGAMRFCLVSREETLSRADAERLRVAATARIADALGPAFPEEADLPLTQAASTPHPAR